jgi:hypothetical protein
MEKFVRVECIEVEEMTKKEFMKKMLGKEEDSLEEGYLIKDESGHMGWISQSDFEKKKYMSCNTLPYPPRLLHASGKESRLYQNATVERGCEDKSAIPGRA